MTDPAENKESISDELSKLGENLKKTIQAMWESEERKKATQGLEQGLADIGKAFDEVAQEVTKGEAAEKIRQEVGDIQERIKSGKLEERVREDLVLTLKKVNDEFNKFSSRWSTKADEDAQQPDYTNAEENNDARTNA